jgi:hypothetical protein
VAQLDGPPPELTNKECIAMALLLGLRWISIAPGGRVYGDHTINLLCERQQQRETGSWSFSNEAALCRAYLRQLNLTK